MPPPTRAPRTGSAGNTFPGSWGYGVGTALMVLGLIFGAVIVFNALSQLAGDVDSLRRDVSNGSLMENLEAGEYFIYDESEGVGVGPVTVRVSRASDGTLVPTNRVEDPFSYDVDGRSGTARASVDLPTDGDYRVEVRSSAGDLVGFALGSDVGSSRTAGVIRGVVIGLVIAALGLALILWTMVKHARWKVRESVAGRVRDSRALVDQGLAEADAQLADVADAGTDLAPDAIDRAGSWAGNRVAEARQRMETFGTTASDSGRPPSWREAMAQRGSAALDRADAQIEGLTGQARAEAGRLGTDGSTPTTGPLGERIGEAYDRVEQRLEAGDSLRSIAADEREAARAAAAEAAAAGRRQAEELRTAPEALDPDLFVAGEATVLDRFGGEVDAFSERVESIGAEVVAESAASAGTAADDLAALGIDLVDDLVVTGTAAAAGVAGAAAYTVDRLVGDEPPPPPPAPPVDVAVPGAEVASPPPVPPPAPPPPTAADASRVDAPPPPPPAPPELLAPAPPVVVEPEPAPVPEPEFEPEPESEPELEVEPEPEPELESELEPAPEPEPEPGPAQVAAATTPPTILAPAPASLRAPPRSVERVVEERQGQSAAASDAGFTALAPPPSRLPSVAARPPRPVRALASPVVSTPVDETMSSSASGDEPTDAAASADTVATAPATKPTRGFDLAPPPAFAPLSLRD